jgi:hypothetical protein
MPHNNIIALVKQALADHKQEHGEFLDDKEYEEWFVKYYLHYSAMMSNHPTSSKKKSRSIWSPENMQKWMPK